MKVLAIYSGGLDSTVMVAKLVREGHVVHTLSFNYGQRHQTELRHAADLAGMGLCVPHRTCDVSAIAPFLQGSSQTDPSVPVPEGHYEEESMKATVVPNRNMVMIALAAAAAISGGYHAIAYGAHAGDHAIYPDCRPDFVDAMRKALLLADWRHVQLLTPFLHYTKAQIVQEGDRLGVPLSLTWSCYKGGKQHCGKCGTCVERREAFKLSGVRDYTRYQGAS